MVTLSALAQDWQATGHTADWLASPFFRLSPWLFAAIVAALLVQALATRRRYRAVDVLTPADQERVRAAIGECERNTSADVVPLVVERSDPETHTLLFATAAVMVTGNVLLAALLPRQGFLRLGLAELGLLALGLALALACPDLRRLFLTHARADATAGEQALIELSKLTQGVPKPAVVLVFVSLFEHRVVVLAQSSTAGALEPVPWPKVVDAVLADVRRGRLADGLVAGVRACAEEMRTAFPATGEPRHAFADRAIARRE